MTLDTSADKIRRSLLHILHTTVLEQRYTADLVQLDKSICEFVEQTPDVYFYLTLPICVYRAGRGAQGAWTFTLNKSDETVVGAAVLSQESDCTVLKLIAYNDIASILLKQYASELAAWLGTQGYRTIPLGASSNQKRLREKQGTEHQGQTEPSQTSLQAKKPGRPPDPKYDQSYELIKNGMPVLEAFQLFCEQVNVEKPDKGLRDSFKKAMKRRRK